MVKVFKTVFLNITAIFKDYMLVALIITVCGAALIIAGMMISAKINGKSAKTALKENLKAICGATVCLLYVSIILNATLFKRLSLPDHDPFSNIFGGWGISELKYFYDFSSVWNVIVFLPLCTFIFIFLKTVLNKKVSSKALFLTAGAAGFLFSCIIELLQIIFKAGTFQFADIFYNTLGGALSVIIFILLRKIYNSAAFKITETKIKSKLNEHSKGRV